MARLFMALGGIALVVASCSGDQPAASTAGPAVVTTAGLGKLEIGLVEVARGFEQPVLALSPPGDPRLFVVDQPGRIWVVGDTATELFVDLSEDVEFGGERGLLGLAFHPDFADNGRFFVDYTGDLGATRIVELVANAGRTAADPSSQTVLLEIPQPAPNHNGGMIAFGPDGFLYIGMGDGGGADDRFGNGQRPDTLLAALLRIDVSTPGEYSIPADNPFAAGGGSPEVWSYGLRNPWRFAFDGDRLFIADVGQNAVEEINALSVSASRGANFGWPIMEGTTCFDRPCDAIGLVEPVFEYGHDEGCSVTGGYVYRGSAIPELAGHYFYSDFCNGWIRSFAPGQEPIEWISSAGRVTSFGQDSAGELYVVVAGGSIFRIERA